MFYKIDIDLCCLHHTSMKKIKAYTSMDQLLLTGYSIKTIKAQGYGSRPGQTAPVVSPGSGMFSQGS